MSKIFSTSMQRWHLMMTNSMAANLRTKLDCFLQHSIQAFPCALALLQLGCLPPDGLLAWEGCQGMLVDGAGRFHTAPPDGLLSICHPGAFPVLLLNAPLNDSLNTGLTGCNHGRLGPFCSFSLLQGNNMACCSLATTIKLRCRHASASTEVPECSSLDAMLHTVTTHRLDM